MIMEKQTQNDEISYSSDWENYNNSPTSSINSSPKLKIFTNSLDKVLNKFIHKLDKIPGKNILDKGLCEKNECLICYEIIDENISKATCSLCNYSFHYECYKNFITNNKNYKNKCIHCSTNTLKFKKKSWWKCCF